MMIGLQNPDCKEVFRIEEDLAEFTNAWKSSKIGIAEPDLDQ